MSESSESRCRAERSPAAEARCGGSPSNRYTPEEKRALLERACQAGGDGRLRLGPLFPGEWQLEVQGGAEFWITRPEEKLFVGPGMQTSLTIDLELCEGVLRLIDAEDGGPLSRSPVALLLRGRPLETWRNLGTDSEGGLVMTQVAGTRHGARRPPALTEPLRAHGA